MCTLDIIKDLLKTNKKTQQELCKYIGVSKQAFTEWNGGRNTSYMKHLPQIAEFFDVSVDYLLGKEEKKAQKEKLPASNEEFIEMLRQYSNGKAQIFFCGSDGKVVDVPPDAEAIFQSVIDTFNKKDSK